MLNDPKISKIERISEIIAYILSLTKNKEIFSKTKLVKVLYLLDVVKSRRDHSDFTGIDYTSYYHGPFSEDIEDGLNLLSLGEYVAINQKTAFSGRLYYHIKLERIYDFGILTLEEKQEIKEIVLPLLQLDLKQVLEITYNTKEYTNVMFGEAISL